jgi:pimeloyl-ACP methyl ester carboxylesterase
MAQITTPAGITLEYETSGSEKDPPLLMVSGFGAQLVAWPRGFCEQLAAGGRFVISYDNRDCGLSSKLDGRLVDMDAINAAAAAGDFERARSLAPYTLDEMAADGLALLDALGIERAHVLGASMGGMIAQTIAIRHPERTLTLTSMMSTTGEPGYGESSSEAIRALLTPTPSERAAYIDASERALIWRSRRWPDVAAVRAVAAESYDRCYYPEGSSRQLAAIVASGSRADGLRALHVPTLVIHGLDDTLVAPSGGERTAALIPNAALMLIPDMGHDRPEPLWPTLCTAILAHTD